MADRATYTFLVHRLSYAELWRLGNGLLGFLILLQVKWLKSAKFDRTDTTSFRAVLLTNADVPERLRPGLQLAREQYTALGFRYLGLDAETLRVGGALAHFARGPVIGFHLIARRLNYASFYSFPPAGRPIVTANGQGYIDNSALYEFELRRKSSLPDLLARHLARIATFGLPDLTDAAVEDLLEQLARNARAHQVARGIFIPHQLEPPLLPIGK